MHLVFSVLKNLFHEFPPEQQHALAARALAVIDANLVPDLYRLWPFAEKNDADLCATAIRKFGSVRDRGAGMLNLFLTLVPSVQEKAAEVVLEAAFPHDSWC